MSAPLYRDPVFDGAADPTVIRKAGTDEWWMFTTQRRPSDPGEGVRWVHGSEIGIAVSADFGRTWAFSGVALGLERGNTLWAPDVVHVDGIYHMYVTVVDGVPSAWTTADAHIVEYRSLDLRHWTRRGRVELGSDRVIDAGVARCADGLWRLWYKNERDGSSTWSASSPELDAWTVEGRVIAPEPPHEGPDVVQLGGWYWMLTDEWRGLGVHRSEDGVHWQRQLARNGLVLNEPGAHPEDRGYGHHASAVVIGDRDGERGVLFYFTHPNGEHSDAPEHERRRSAIHIAAMTVEDGTLFVERNVTVPAPVLQIA